MAYVPVPKDLSRIKTKVLFYLTKRQLICFGIGGGISLPVFFLLRGKIGNSAATFIMIMLLLPFFLLAMYEKNGKPFEKVIYNMLKVMLLRPKKRPYKTKNFYDVLEAQDRLEKEVNTILHHGTKVTNPGKSSPGKNHKSGAQKHSGGRPPGKEKR